MLSVEPTVAHFCYNMRSYGGAARQAVGLARRIRGFRSIFFNFEEVPRAHAELTDPSEDGFPVVHVPRPQHRRVVAVLRYARRFGADIFHVHGLIGAALLAGRLSRKPMVLKTTLLGTDDLDAIRAKRFGRLWLELVRGVDVNVALSVAIETINAKHLGSTRIERLPNGVELGASVRAKTDPCFCVVGLLAPRKRTHVAIERFLASYAGDEAARLYVVGPGAGDVGLAETDCEYLQYCRSWVPAERRQQVVFTGHLESAELRRIYAASLGFFCFSEFEGMPNALLEAMAANCVPIVGEMGGVAKEIIPSAGTGFVLAPGDPMPSLEDLRRVSAARSPAARMHAAYSFESVAERYAEIYASLLSPR